MKLVPALLVLLLGGCGQRGASNYACGFAAMAGLSLVLEQFATPASIVARVPDDLPNQLPVRMVLGPALRSIVGRADTTLVIGVEGELPSVPSAGFGVLIVNRENRPQGVLLYEGIPVQGAPLLGSVNIGARDVPLLGLRLDITQFEDQSCPTFPDSLR